MFTAVNAKDVLHRHGLDSFESLWRIELDAVDAPNTNRGGWSSVYRLELDDANGRAHAFYLKRQSNHLTRTLRHPLGEPTFAREFRAIQSYAHCGIPSLQAALFAQRSVDGEHQAVLLTRALDDYQALDIWYQRWHALNWRERQDLILASAALIRALHNAGKVHNCLYPKHVFLKLDGDGAGARLIDLEKTRRAWMGRRDYAYELSTFNRRSNVPSRSQRLRFLLAYLGKQRVDQEVRDWASLVQRRTQYKAKE